MAKKNKVHHSKHVHTDMKDIYEIKNEKLEKKNVSCPKCGDGTFLAEHKNRQHCGKCGYTKWKQ